MIEIEGLTKTYGDKVAVDHLSLRVEAGELFALVGGHGAGKSTTANLLLGFTVPTSGTAAICGLDVVRDGMAVKRQVAFMAEGAELYGDLTARQNVEFFASLGGRCRLGAASVDLALRRAGLPEHAFGARARAFPRSVRQRLALAVVLVKEASVVIMDEPLGGLDPRTADELSALLSELRTEGRSLLLCTHDLFRASQICERVGLMKEGRLALVRTAAQLRQEDLRQLYLDYMQT